jgi:cysteinyl-tRNA synthetase
MERSQSSKLPRPYGAADPTLSGPGPAPALTLRLTNTLTRAKADFVPLHAGKVSIYCCGVTVYDLCHLGHARSYIVWDVLRRYLIWLGYQVTFVQNYTDIDDKILARAAAEGSSMEAVSERNIDAFVADMADLNILPATRMPRATRSLDAIRSLIGELEARGAAYSVDGDVYFAVLKHRDYGKLSGRDLAEQQDNASGRVATVEEGRKHHPFDFALWKGAKPGEPSFPSPWGPGRPGWHIECSAMVREELGTTIDIHLGGADLIFPHHENEIAQSEAASGQELARWWLHNGMVNVDGEKMSKSLGNFTTIRALLESGVSPMTLRLFVLQAHYRKPLDFTAAALEAAATGWKGVNAALGLPGRGAPTSELSPEPAATDGGGTSLPLSAPARDTLAAESPEVGAGSPDLANCRRRFTAAMDDDLNTSAALAVLFDLAKPLRAVANRIERGDAAAFDAAASEAIQAPLALLTELAGVLGLQHEAGPFERSGSEGLDIGAITALIEQRRTSKAVRDFATADRIRDELKSQGIELIDRPGGTTEWLRR